MRLVMQIARALALLALVGTGGHIPVDKCRGQARLVMVP